MTKSEGEMHVAAAESLSIEIDRVPGLTVVINNTEEL